MTVTVIVSTYNRPQTLRTALAALQMQTVEDWRAIVVGDCCGPPTGEAVAEIGDPRISYVNLPQRCGEQSIPNSVGMRLAQTPLIAFLNHDDIWLPDHLWIALQSLETSGADAFVGRAAFSFVRMENGAGPLFSEASPLGRTLLDAFHSAAFVFEPASAWVMRKSAAERVGDWRHSSSIYRTPLEDWVLRAARARLSLALDDRISVLKVTTHSTAPGRHYDRDAADQLFVIDMIKRVGAEGVRDFLATDLPLAPSRGCPPRDPSIRPVQVEARRFADLLLTPENAERFLRTGWDAFDLVHELAKLQRGASLREALRARTGETVAPPPSIDELMLAITRPA